MYIRLYELWIIIIIDASKCRLSVVVGWDGLTIIFVLLLSTLICSIVLYVKSQYVTRNYIYQINVMEDAIVYSFIFLVD